MLGFKGRPAHPDRCIAQADGLILEVLELLAALIGICSPALEGYASTSELSRACLQWSLFTIRCLGKLHKTDGIAFEIDARPVQNDATVDVS